MSQQPVQEETPLADATGANTELPLCEPDVFQPHDILDGIEWVEGWSPGPASSMTTTRALSVTPSSESSVDEHAATEPRRIAPPPPPVDLNAAAARPALTTRVAVDTSEVPIVRADPEDDNFDEDPPDEDAEHALQSTEVDPNASSLGENAEEVAAAEDPSGVAAGQPPTPPPDAFRRVLVTPPPNPDLPPVENAPDDLDFEDVDPAAFDDEDPTNPVAPTLKERAASATEPELHSDEVDALMSEILADEAQPGGPAGSERRRTTMPGGWFLEIFDETYLQTLPSNHSRRCEREAAHIARLLRIAPGARVLDVGCGPGDHAIALSALGFEVVGLDKSLPLLEHGLRNAQTRSLSVKFVLGDMRDFDVPARFDAAYCVGTTFGYFDDEQNLRVARAIRAAVAPGGHVVIEQLNRDWAIAQLPRRTWWESGELVIMEDLGFDATLSRLRMERSVLDAEQRTWEQHISIRLYALHEWFALLRMAGFEVVSWGGHWATPGAYFDGRSSQIVIVARNPG